MDDNCKEKKVDKGVNKSIIDHVLKHNYYRECLFNSTTRIDTMNNIRSKQHEIYSISTSKISLSSIDNKRYQLDDGISSLAYNHYKTKELQ